MYGRNFVLLWRTEIPSKQPRPQGGALKPKFSKPKTEIPNQVRDDKKTRTEPSCHAELGSASNNIIDLRDPESSSG
jgi:hypothetical protein